MIDLDRLADEAQARADEEANLRQRAAIEARQEFEVAADVAKIYRDLCRQVAERLRTRKVPSCRAFDKYYDSATNVPVELPVRGWGVAGHILFEDGRLVLATPHRAPQLSDPPRRLFPDNAELMLKMHRVHPGELFFVAPGEDDAFSLKPAGSHAHGDLPFEGVLRLCQAPGGTEPDSSDGRKIMWPAMNAAYETEMRSLDQELASLLAQ